MNKIAIALLMIATAFAGCVGDDTENQPPAAVDDNGVNDAPLAVFTVTPLTGDKDTEFTVDASASTDPDGDQLTYSWDWGDDTKSQGVKASHKYTATDTKFKITLTATDPGALSSSASKLITLGSGKNAPPLVSLSGENLWIKPGEAARLKATAKDPDGDAIAGITWSTGKLPAMVPANVDSGDIKSGATWSASFSEPGRYLLHCHPHPWMKQVVIVDPAAPPGTTATAQILDGSTTEEFFYSPAELRVRPGTKITWENKGAVVHTVTQEGFEPLFSKISLASAGGNHTFKEAGKWVVRAEAKDAKGAVGYGTLNVLVEADAPDAVYTRQWGGNVTAPTPPGDSDPLQTKKRHTFVMEFPSNATFNLTWTDPSGGGLNKLKFAIYEGVTDANPPVSEGTAASGTSIKLKLPLKKSGYNVVIQAESGLNVPYSLTLTAIQDIKPPADAGGHDDGGGHQH